MTLARGEAVLKAGDKVAARYVLERLLGRGGMGAVYVARDEKFGVQVALKIATLHGSLAGQYKDRFIREARVGNRLGKEKGFVRALDWGEIPDSSIYLAMDLVEGARPLDLMSGSLPERLVRLTAAVRLVALAHSAGVIHRDLKPANFLEGADGTLWLADFGLAKFVGENEPGESALEHSLTNAGIAMGTPAFMPPEQFESAKTVDVRADVYALGVMLFVALTGRLPFDGSPSEILSQQLKVSLGRDPMPRAAGVDPHVPAELDELCSHAIALDRGQRLATAGELFRKLEVVSGRKRARLEMAAPLTAPEEPTPGRASLVPIVAGAVALLVVLAIAAVGLAVHARASGTPVANASPERTPGATPAPPSGSEPTPEPLPEPTMTVEDLPSPEPTAAPTATAAPVVPPAPEPPPAKIPDELKNLGLTRVGERSFYTYSYALKGADPLLFVYVPPGDFRMGRDDSKWAKPAHTHVMAKGYFIGMRDVTWAQYQVFCKATGERVPVTPFWWGRDRGEPPAPNHPVVNVAWDEARHFCQWGGLHLLKLPTEAQWEKAARGTDGRAFPWGNAIPDSPKGFINFCDKSVPVGTRLNWLKTSEITFQGTQDDGYPYTSPVDACPLGASFYGALDMAGNVLQWCEDEWDIDAYEHYLEHKPPASPSPVAKHVNRGGSWASRLGGCETTARSSWKGQNPALGFRVVIDGE